MTSLKTRQMDLVDETVEEMTRERPDLDASTIETVCRLIYAGRMMESFASKTLKPLGMNYTDLDVLGSLRCAEDLRELTPAELMRAAMITSGAMSICLGRLEDKNLIKRRVSEEDRRVRKVSITPKGIRLIDRAFSLRFGAAKQLLAGISPKRIAALNMTLREISDATDHDPMPLET